MSSRWTYSPALKADYRFDPQRNAYVLRNGAVIPSDQLPRTPGPGQPAARGTPIPNAGGDRNYPNVRSQASDTIRSANAPVPTSIPRPPNSDRSGIGAVPAGYASYGAYASSPTAQKDALYRAVPSSSQLEQSPSLTGAMESLTMRSAPEGEVFVGSDKSRRIKSAIQFTPPEAITEPGMYNEGFKAHAKLVALPTSHDTEALDARYTIRKSPGKFFVPGRVFLVLWAEPAGAGSMVTTFPLGTALGKYREQVFSKVRRFIVIRSGDRSCSALPIYTYDGQGARKPGLLASEHGHVFTGKSLPDEAARIPDMLSKAIRMLPHDKSDKLDPQSLIHYGKVYTIEHNIKVRPLGLVDENHMPALRDQFTDVWVFRLDHTAGAARRPQGGARLPPNSPQSLTGSGPRQGAYLTQQMPGQSFTEQQSNAYQEYGAIAQQREVVQRGGSSGRRSARGSTVDSDARGTPSVASGGPASSRPASDNRYRAAIQALIDAGHTPDAAVNLVRQRLAQQQSNTPSTASLSQSPPSSTAEAAVAQLVSQGYTREAAIRYLRQRLGGA